MKKHIISFSGGKDSTAMLIRMVELGMTIDEVVFADTKLEFPEMYVYIKKVERYIGRKITVLKEGDWDKWFYGKSTRGKTKGQMRGFPLGGCLPCWHSREAKFKPLNKFCNGNIRYLGYALDENSNVRKQKIAQYRFNGGKDKDYIYPLVDWRWTEKDCADYLKDKNLHNPLYGRFTRTGCYLCPKQGKKSLFVLFKHYPDLWAKLLRYVNEAPNNFNHRDNPIILDKEWRTNNGKR